MKARLALLLLVACAHETPRPTESTEVKLPVDMVASVAAAEHVPLSEAVRRVTEDEVAAAGARLRGLDRRPPTSWKLRAAEARFTSDRLMAEAKGAGPPTTEEVNALSAKHWAEVDRPPAMKVFHAVVLRPKDSSRIEAAKKLAADLEAATAGAVDDADFERRAKSVKAPNLEVRCEALPQAFIADGHTVDGGKLDSAFAKAAFTLKKPGDMTGVVESSFGWHVIRLVEILPEKRMPYESRVVAFADEVTTLRAHELLEKHLAELRAAHAVKVSPAAEQLMRSALQPTPADSAKDEAQ